MMELSQHHLGEENIAVYGGYANKLIKLQNDLLQTLDRRRRGTASRSWSNTSIFTPAPRGWSEL